jgi:hypothetical protein
VLSKAELRRSRIAADLSTAEDGDMSFEEASVALHSIAMGRTALEGHYIGPPPTLLPTLLMFHGRFQRLVRVFSFSFFFLFLFFFPTTIILQWTLTFHIFQLSLKRLFFFFFFSSFFFFLQGPRTKKIRGVTHSNTTGGKEGRERGERGTQDRRRSQR